jgi:signal transduction histidine kinase/DNA-binding response OmpR family regulator
MNGTPRKPPGFKVYGKIAFVIISCVFALGLAYLISKVAFDEMLSKVDKVSTPNAKLRLVSRISRDILQIDQHQRSQVLNDKNYSGYSDESDYILRSLDTLTNLYSRNDLQRKRIDSIRVLLNERDRLFHAYVQVRKKLVDNQAFSSQIKNISSLIQSAPKSDSTIVTTEKRVTTRTVDKPAETDDRGLLARIFRKNKPREADSVPATVEEELQVQVDTIENTASVEMDAQIDSAIHNLEQRQRLRNSAFMDLENELTIAGNVLVSNMVNMLHEVELEAMKQMERENVDARNVVNESVKRISLILLTFFLVAVILFYLILSDIRRSNAYRLELEEAKNEAEYHGAAKQRFLSNMSHELRTPLQSIIGYAEQLRASDQSPEYANVIYQSAEHLLQIVNEILDYNQIISGKFNFLKQTVDVRKVAEEVVDVMQPQAIKKNIRLTLSTRLPQDAVVTGDAFRLKQILFNLVGNAIKFTDEGEVLLQVSGTIYGHNTEIIFRVCDSGPGIAEEDIEKVFHEFEQAGNANSGIHFGNGLGLTIVRNLVDGLGGSIHVKSTVNKGSVFTVSMTLPTATEETTSEKPGTSLQSTNRFDSTVWLIDDDRFILDLCHRILNKYNIAHVSFDSPEKALTAPFDPKLTHIFTDMRMPKMSGSDLYKELRAQYSEQVKIIAFTAQALPDERNEILSSGFDSLLLKPFKESDLLAALGLHAPETDDREESGIIELFKRDTKTDLRRLEKYIREGRLADAELLAHRLAGRTAQLGGTNIAFLLRKTEIDLRNGDQPPLSEIARIKSQLETFMEEYKNEELSKTISD